MFIIKLQDSETGLYLTLLLDHRSTAETPTELMRPYLHEFLTSAYVDYDIVIWCEYGIGSVFFCSFLNNVKRCVNGKENKNSHEVSISVCTQYIGVDIYTCSGVSLGK